MNGLASAVVVKDQDMLATMAREGKRLPANAFLAWELVMHIVKLVLIFIGLKLVFDEEG